MRYFFIVSMLFCISKVLTAQIVCPPDATVECYEYEALLDNVVVEVDKFELVPKVTQEESGCNSSELIIEYFLYDLVNESQEQTAACIQNVIVKAFDPEQLTWPAAIIYVDDISNLTGIPSLIEGLLPAIDNRCNFVYSYQDTPISLSTQPKVLRTWTGLDWCTGKTYTFEQLIIENSTTVNGLFLNLNNCGNSDVQLENYEIRINGLVADDNLCDYITLLGVLNCVAETNNVTSNDEVSLVLTSVNSPLNGVNTIDYVKIKRHILGLETFYNPCSLWAADVNSDNLINGLDLVELRKLILGIYTELPQGHPELFSIDGSPDKPLVFRGDEFPLQDLQIIHVNKGNVNY